MLTNCSGLDDAAAWPFPEDARLAMCFITAPWVSGSRKRPRIKSDISSNYLYIDGRPDGGSGPPWKVMVLPAKRVLASWQRWHLPKCPNDAGLGWSGHMTHSEVQQKNVIRYLAESLVNLWTLRLHALTWRLRRACPRNDALNGKQNCLSGECDGQATHYRLTQ